MPVLEPTLKSPLRIATRKSKLALAQVEWVKSKLFNFYPDLKIEIIPITSSGDRFLSAPLYKIGGKGLFVKELDEALLSNQADIAVHSTKDIPQSLVTGLTLTTICERENPFDAWICPSGAQIMQLEPRQVVGTSSLRRMVQLKKMRPDLQYKSLRGNIMTRLQKCESGEYDAIVLAQAGLNRVQLAHKATHTFLPTEMLPAVGQGAIGIVCVEDNHKIHKIIECLQHRQTTQAVMAERAMNHKLNGSCQVSIAGFAQIQHGELSLRGLVGDPNSDVLLEAKSSLAGQDYQRLGEQVAAQLINQGALEIIESLGHPE